MSLTRRINDYILEAHNHHTLESAKRYLDSLSRKYNIPYKLEMDDIGEGILARGGGGRVTLNTPYWTAENLANQEKAWDGMAVDPSIEGVLTHEFGHVINNVVLNKMGMKNYLKTLKRILGTDRTDLKGTTNHDHVSPYAMENIWEATAEMFSAYHFNKTAPGWERGLPTAKAVWTEFIKHL